MTLEQEQILVELRELAGREQEEADRFRASDAYQGYWAARAEQEEELQRLALRGKWQGLTPSVMAAAYSKGQPSFPPLSYQAMTAILRQAQESADKTVTELIRQARIEEMMRTEGLTQQQATEQWSDETSASTPAQLGDARPAHPGLRRDIGHAHPADGIRVTERDPSKHTKEHPKVIPGVP